MASDPRGQGWEWERSDGSLLLAAEARRGDRDAANELLRACRGYLYLIASRELAPAVQARVSPSDVVQDACTRIYQCLEQFRGDTDDELKGWMAQIVRNRCREVERELLASGKRDLARETTLNANGSAAGPADWLEAQVDSPSTQALANELDERIERVLGELPAEYREIIRLRQWQRWEFGEIAQALNRSEAATRKLWFRAVQQFSERLREKLGDEFQSSSR